MAESWRSDSNDIHIYLAGQVAPAGEYCSYSTDEVITLIEEGRLPARSGKKMSLYRRVLKGDQSVGGITRSAFHPWDLDKAA